MKVISNIHKTEQLEAEKKLLLEQVDNPTMHAAAVIPSPGLDIATFLTQAVKITDTAVCS